MLFQNIKKDIEKRIYNFLKNRKKYNLPDNELNSLFGGSDCGFYCLNRYTIKLYKNRSDSNFVKANQCSLKRSNAVFTEINPKFCSKPSPFSTKTDS